MTAHTMQGSDLRAAGSWTLKDTRAGSPGFNTVLSQIALPTIDVNALKAEELAWGYDAAYRALADSARDALKPVWVSATGVSIGSTPLKDLGVSGLDADLRWWLGGGVVPGRSVEIMNRLRQTGGLPAPAVVADAAPATTWPAERAAALLSEVFGFDFVPGDITLSEIVSRQTLASTSNPADYGIQSWLNARSSSEFGLLISMQAPTNVTDMSATSGIYGTSDGLVLRITASAGTKKSLVTAAAFTFGRNRALASWNTMTGITSYEARLSGLRAPTVLTTGATKTGETMQIATDVAYSHPGSRAAGFEYVIHSSYAGSAITGFTTFLDGEIWHGSMRVFSMPPGVDGVHVLGDVTRDLATKKIELEQKFIVLDWRGQALASLSTGLTADEIANLKKLIVRSCLNTTAEWLSPTSCLENLAAYKKAAENGYDLASEVWCAADPAKGQEELTFRKASNRASNLRLPIVHHILMHNEEASNVRVTYNGSLVGGYTYTAVPIDGTTASYTIDDVREFVMAGCTEVNSTTDGTTLAAVRLAVLDVSAQNVEDYGKWITESGAELQEALIFRGRAPNPDTLTLGGRSGFYMLHSSPPRGNLTAFIGGALQISKIISKRVTY